MGCVGWVVGSGTFYSRLIYGNILWLHVHIHFSLQIIYSMQLYVNVVSVVYGRFVDL